MLANGAHLLNRPNSAIHLAEDLKRLLCIYQTSDSDEEAAVQQLHDFVSSTPISDLFGGSAVHVTAASVVMNRSRDALLLVWHSSFGRWLQPGGHIEPAVDFSIESAARRELLEETAICATDLQLMLPGIFDIDCHSVRYMPDDIGHDKCRRHFDIRFLYTLTREGSSDFSADVAWIQVKSLLAEPSSVSRFARKVRSLSIGTDRPK